MVAIIVGREFAVTALRTLAHARGASMPASPLGKIKMIAQIVAILALILGKDHLSGFVVIGQVALWVVVVTALVSAADYFRRFSMFLNPKVVALRAAPRKARADRKAG
jgi:CDP-diacylglycerol--glycerol-3-phosphate 3-phosphatidyltransferase